MIRAMLSRRRTMVRPGCSRGRSKAGRRRMVIDHGRTNPKPREDKGRWGQEKGHNKFPAVGMPGRRWRHKESRAYDHCQQYNYEAFLFHFFLLLTLVLNLRHRFWKKVQKKLEVVLREGNRFCTWISRCVHKELKILNISKNQQISLRRHSLTKTVT